MISTLPPSRKPILVTTQRNYLSCGKRHGIFIQQLALHTSSLNEDRKSHLQAEGSYAKMGSGTKTVKILMVVANVFFLLAGIALIAFAAYVRAEDNDYNSVFGKGGPFAPANVMIAAGVVIFFVSFLGCVGALKENKCFLVIFIIFIVIILLCETAIIILAFVYRSEAKRYATDAVSDAVKNTYGEDGQSAASKAIDNIQKNFKCCGANNYTDWETSKWATKNPSLRVPMSCCSDTTSLSCQNKTLPDTDIFKKNCATELESWAEKNLAIIGGLACGVILIELLAIVFAAIIMRSDDSVHIA